MRHVAICLAALLLLGPPIGAQESAKPKAPPANEQIPLSPAEQFKAISLEYAKATSAFLAEYRKAKTQEERQKLKFPNPEPVAQKCLDLARKYPKDPVAEDALVWVVQRTGGPTATAAMDLLLRDHLHSPKMKVMAQVLTYSSTPDADKHLLALLEKNTNKDVKGMACFGLAQVYKRKAEQEKTSESKREELYKQSEQYCNRIIADFADVKSYRPLGDLAKSELFEIQHLRIGMTAPIIEGEDIDGKKFSLKDYRGKVVVLDFWGNW